MAIQNPVTILGVDSDGNSTNFGTIENGGLGASLATLDRGIGTLRSNRYETTIGYAANLTGFVGFLQSEDIRAYRLFPSANMRYIEDAQNVTQANILLNSAAAQTATTGESVDYSIARVAAAGIDGWTEWVELDKDPDLPSLSALWFGLDAAGTGATVFVETR